VKQIFACIGFLSFVVLSFNTHSANAQSSNQSLWDLFVEESVREFGSQATQKVLRSMFGTDTDARNAQQPDKPIICEVIDPTGTPLNVRATPNGEEIVTTLSNRPDLKIEAITTKKRQLFYFYPWVVNDSSWHLLHESGDREIKPTII
jgi:hypothetical protein